VLGLLAAADECAEGADHSEDARYIALVENVNGKSCAREVSSDRCLKVREGENQIGLQRDDLRDVGRGEGQDLVSRADLGRPNGISGDADDAVLLAEEIEGLDRFFRMANETARRISAHGSLVRHRECRLPLRQLAPPIGLTVVLN
jgi:hypothetical protein